MLDGGGGNSAVPSSGNSGARSTIPDRWNHLRDAGEDLVNSGTQLALFAAGLAIVLVLLDQAPAIGGWILLLLVLGLLILHPQKG